MNNQKFDKKKRIIHKTLIGITFLAISLISASSAWASLTLIKPSDASYPVEISYYHQPLDSGTKSRAPEPTTFALFFSGIIGMVVQFVRRSYEAFKRTFDFMSSVFALIVLSPLLLLTAIAIKLTSKGPVFYMQTRVGKGGRHFEIIKFRSMRVNAENETGAIWAAANDNRLTPIGGFLRKTHIDEIPQFINVLRGEMSVIGPRPERPVFVERFKKEITNYEKRLNVKPGITGLAQVWHRYDETIEDVKKKIKYDLLYIRKLCLTTDLQIIVRTFRVVFTGEGAR